MKSLLVFILLTGSISSFAKNSLTKVQVETLESAGLLQNLKVKLNKQATSIYVKGSNRVTDVSTTTITRTIDKETLREVVPSSVNGIIVKFDGNRLWVSFDTDCFSESCSYRFDTNVEGDKFLLRGIPEYEGYNLTAVKTGKLLPASKRRIKDLFLQASINNKTITNILKTTETATGH